MNVFFDTSTIIALLVSNHPSHTQANKIYLRMNSPNMDLYIASHSIAEIYRTLTWGKSYLNFPAKQANEIIQDSVFPVFKVINLEKKDYELTLKRLKKRKLTGAIIYDALIAQAASKVNSDYLITFNVKDFTKVLPNEKIELLAPEF